MKVGYVGLGAMGKALATRLVRQYDLLVWDIDETARRAMVAKGATDAGSLAAIGEKCELIFLCLPKSEHVEAVLFGETGLAEHLRPGTTVVDQTSGMPALTKVFSDKLDANHVALMDAPVAGGVPAAQAGTITIMASGPSQAVSKATPALHTISQRLYLCGESVGSAQLVKSINNLLNTANRILTLELAAIGRTLGLSMDQVLTCANQPASKSFLTERLLSGIAEGKASTDFAISLMVKDTNLASDFAASQNVAMPVCEVARGCLTLALRILGNGARLEDLIPHMQHVFAVSYTDTSPSLKERADVSVSDAKRLISDAFSASHMVIAFEGFELARRAGLDIQSFCDVINAGSGASSAGEKLFHRLLTGEPFPANADRLKTVAALTDYGRKHQLPALVLNQIAVTLMGRVHNAQGEEIPA